MNSAADVAWLSSLLVRCVYCIFSHPFFLSFSSFALLPHIPITPLDFVGVARSGLCVLPTQTHRNHDGKVIHLLKRKEKTFPQNFFANTTLLGLVFLFGTGATTTVLAPLLSPETVRRWWTTRQCSYSIRNQLWLLPPMLARSRHLLCCCSNIWKNEKVHFSCEIDQK